MSSRQYDIVLWGATGHTGGWTAKHIARSYPTDIRWAIAGRSESKLKALAESCAKINPDRVQPCKTSQKQRFKSFRLFGNRQAGGANGLHWLTYLYSN